MLSLLPNLPPDRVATCMVLLFSIGHHKFLTKGSKSLLVWKQFPSHQGGRAWESGLCSPEHEMAA